MSTKLSKEFDLCYFDDDKSITSLTPVPSSDSIADIPINAYHVREIRRVSEGKVIDVPVTDVPVTQQNITKESSAQTEYKSNYYKVVPPILYPQRKLTPLPILLSDNNSFNERIKRIENTQYRHSLAIASIVGIGIFASIFKITKHFDKCIKSI